MKRECGIICGTLLMMDGSNSVTVLLIATGLSADCFAVALGGGIANPSFGAKQVLRVAGSFGLFQAGMAVLGWAAGETVVSYISRYGYWVAFLLLVFVSGRMFWEAFHSEDSREKEMDISRGVTLLVLSVATSIDTLAVGFSFAFLKASIVVASPTIGAVAFVATALGFMLGKSLGRLAGRWAVIVGAVILLGIALRILLSQVL